MFKAYLYHGGKLFKWMNPQKATDLLQATDRHDHIKLYLVHNHIIGGNQIHNKNADMKLIYTTRFWNNLQQVRSTDCLIRGKSNYNTVTVTSTCSCHDRKLSSCLSVFYAMLHFEMQMCTVMTRLTFLSSPY